MPLQNLNKSVEICCNLTTSSLIERYQLFLVGTGYSDIPESYFKKSRKYLLFTNVQVIYSYCVYLSLSKCTVVTLQPLCRRGLAFTVSFQLSNLWCPLTKASSIHQVSVAKNTYVEHRLRACVWISSNFLRKEAYNFCWSLLTPYINSIINHHILACNPSLSIITFSSKQVLMSFPLHWQT